MRNAQRKEFKEREILDAIRRGLLACHVDHDDAEWFASHVLDELKRIGLVQTKTPEEVILEEVYGPDYLHQQKGE